MSPTTSKIWQQYNILFNVNHKTSQSIPRLILVYCLISEEKAILGALIF